MKCAEVATYSSASHPSTEFDISTTVSMQRAAVMSDPSIMSHMFISSFGAGKHENGASVLPLPLNLIALIISYVYIEYKPVHGSEC